MAHVLLCILTLFLLIQKTELYSGSWADEPSLPRNISSCSYPSSESVVLILNCTGYPDTVVVADSIQAAKLNLTGGNANCQHKDSDKLCTPWDLAFEQIPDCLGKKSFCRLESFQKMLECNPKEQYNYLVALNFYCKNSLDINVVDICNSSSIPTNGSRIQSPNYPSMYHKTGETCHQTINPEEALGYAEFHFVIKSFHIEESTVCDQNSKEYVKINSSRDFYVEKVLLSDQLSYEESRIYAYNEDVYLCNEAEEVTMVIIYGYDAVIEFKIARPGPGPGLTGFNIEHIAFNATEPTQGPTTTSIETTSKNDVITTSGLEGDPNGGQGISQAVVISIIIVGVTILVTLVIVVLIIGVKNRRYSKQSLPTSVESIPDIVDSC